MGETDAVIAGDNGNILPDNLSFPLLAGWLLGYPCLYHTPTVTVSGTTDTDTGEIGMNSGVVNCLSNVALLKYSLYVSATEAKSKAKSKTKHNDTDNTAISNNSDIRHMPLVADDIQCWD